MIERLTRRVVVTGMGLVTPLGTGLEKTWKALCAGKSGIARITRFDPTDYPCQIAGEVPDFDPAAFIEKKEIKKMDLFIHFAVGAAQMAVDDAGLKVTGENADRVGVYIGAGIGGLPAIEHYHKILLEKGAERVSPFFIPMVIINLASGQVAIRLGARGPNSCAVTACATGNHCIGDAFRLIQRGDADVMLAGGTEAAITPLGVAGFAAARAMSTRNDDPAHASRPFDRDRDGFVMAEGAAVLVLEELEHALRRGAPVYAEVLGYGLSNDAYHMTAPLPSGRQAARAIRLALGEAGLDPCAIGYVNAHASSTPLNDRTETLAIKEALGDHARDVPVSGTKGLHAHALGATGAIEAAICALAIERAFLPATANLEHPGDDCDLRYVRGDGEARAVDYVLSNSFGFGGINAALVLGRYR